MSVAFPHGSPCSLAAESGIKREEVEFKRKWYNMHVSDSADMNSTVSQNISINTLAAQSGLTSRDHGYHVVIYPDKILFIFLYKFFSMLIHN